MTPQEETRSAMTKLEWGVVFSVLASACSIVFSAGVVWSKLQMHEAAIAELKGKDGATTDRLARIETKLDIMLADREAKQNSPSSQ
ncbi:hypothetical protein [Novosphingobium clariflavum]|uniref:Uncharacterized protein n=1 Tax=Novosphingobium clariflavum TaxID=2029884 RepID=A0ABV6SBT1_9SPHN|nr:hypothetical protein [Novosphingobium clariflavum]